MSEAHNYYSSFSSESHPSRLLITIYWANIYFPLYIPTSSQSCYADLSSRRGHRRLCEKYSAPLILKATSSQMVRVVFKFLNPFQLHTAIQFHKQHLLLSVKLLTTREKEAIICGLTQESKRLSILISNLVVVSISRAVLVKLVIKTSHCTQKKNYKEWPLFEDHL